MSVCLVSQWLIFGDLLTLWSFFSYDKAHLLLFLTVNLGWLHAQHGDTLYLFEEGTQLHAAMAVKALNLKAMGEIPRRKQVASRNTLPVFVDLYQRGCFFAGFFFRYTFLFLSKITDQIQKSQQKKIAGLNCGPERLNTVTPSGLASRHARHHKTCLCRCFLQHVLN